MSDKTILGQDLENVYNLNEGAVVEAAERILADDDGACKCKMCLEDVFALALNNLPAKYIQSYYSTHDIAEFLDHKQVEKAVKTAVKQVAKSPHHD